MKMRSGAPRCVLVAMLLASLPAFAQDDKWIRLKTAHFEMYALCDQKKAREAILYFERVRDFFIQASPMKAVSEFPTRIVAFGDPDLFHVYAPNELVQAYYAPGPVRDSIVMEDPSPASYPVAIHEYVHLMVNHSGLKIPLWLNEGWAEVYSTLRPVKDGVAVGDLIEPDVKTLNEGDLLLLPQLDAITPHSPEYNESRHIGMFYAESWALTHMLYLSPDYKNNFGTFVIALNRGRSLEDALRAAFNKTSDQVFVDLQNYLKRKKLYGTVFEAPMEKAGEAPEVSPLTSYDSYVNLADLQAAAHHITEAGRLYQQLEAEEPNRPEAFAGAGYLAIEVADKATARKEFQKAYALGSTDPQLCMQLATLDREAKQPASVVMDELQRAVNLRPGFSDAIFQLALLKVDARDFDAALDLLGQVGTVSPEHMTIYRSALAYCHLEKGSMDLARSDAEAARRAAKTPAETQAVDKLLQLINARSRGPAAVQPGETVLRAQGTAVGMRCPAPGSAAMSQLGVVVDGQQKIFEVPPGPAVEITRQPGTAIQLACGAFKPFPVIVEYVPASVANQQSAGIVRRLVF